MFALAPFGALVAQYMATMKEFPPRQTPESWSPAAFLEKLRQKQEALEGNVVK
jgi:arylsulfatase